MDIPSKYNPKEVETKIYSQWLAKGYFHAVPNQAKKPFTIVIPPPNITGILHMGHALNNTIQDVLIRSKRMRGFEALWMPGTDHAGIATQNVVEKDLAKEGKKKDDIGRPAFIERLWQWRDKYGSIILQQLKNLGASCDWERTRFTMDEAYSEAVKETFIRLYEKGLIYRGEYIINWCPRCKTALSDEEAAHKEINGWLYYIKYPVKLQGAKLGAPEPSEASPQGNAGHKMQDNYVIVATTRPETMLGDTALAINPKDERHSWLKGAKIILPIMERELTLVEDELIDVAFGTGAVKVTPAHDPVDFNLAKKHNLAFINIMNADATLNQNAGEFSGMDRFEARQALLEVLEEKKLIEKKEPYKISAGHCYRCHTIVEPRLSLQWFVDMKPLAKPAITAVEEGKVRFHPERWRKVYLNWMNNIQDWCISRQIWWGHQLPVYYCKSCTVNREPCTENTVNGKPSTVNEKGIIVSKTKPEKCPDCGSSDITQDTDVLDTWFSSWLWPFATFGWPSTGSRLQTPGSKQESLQPTAYSLQQKDLDYFYPTSVLSTASEILFFWVARMIMAGLEFMKEMPFKDVIIHGTVRDERGIKMSKSLGNIIDPLEIIDKFGADPLRFSLMLTAASGSDIHLSDEKFLVGRNFCNKIWNATRFLFLKINDTGVKLNDIDLKEIDEIDAWVLSELNRAIVEATEHLDTYRLNDATKVTYEFFWHTFCDWYIEIIKDNFTLNRAKTATYILLNALKLLHPFMPFITEEIFQSIKQNTGLKLEESIMIASWPKTIEIISDPIKLKRLEILVQTIKTIRNIKTDLGLGTKKINLAVKASKEDIAYWQENEIWIKRLAAVEKIEFKDKLLRVLHKSERWELDFTLENIDTSVFLVSLGKKLKESQNLLERTKERLANDNFLTNASVETIAQEKEKMSQVSLQAKRLKELYDALQ
ncbi:MAG: valine--tRNA ligase [Candidatus Omnitrophica bacterium]|nr:valine--tRNA ligase [Candidatus Omnitrophota bacterium]